MKGDAMNGFDHIEPRYRGSVIKGYEHFTLLLNEDQKLLGRAVVWLNRPGDMQHLSDLSLEEWHELRHVIQEHRYALDVLWAPDLMNYAWLGNFIHEHRGHGHMHLIPRYKTLRTFQSVTFTDERWARNYPQDSYVPIPRLFVSIRDALRRLIPGSEQD